jgi:hypothetical protein
MPKCAFFATFLTVIVYFPAYFGDCDGKCQYICEVLAYFFENRTIGILILQISKKRVGNPLNMPRLGGTIVEKIRIHTSFTNLAGSKMPC